MDKVDGVNIFDKGEKMDYYYKQPQYYSMFHCIGGDCPLSCCDNWNIIWFDKEIKKLKSAETSDELRKKIERSFVYNEDQKAWIVRMSRDRRCPFHNRDTGLCDIQKELGESFLGDTCKSYPRTFFLRDNIIIRSINCSCPALLNIIINNKNAVVMESMLKRNIEVDLGDTLINTENEAVGKRSPYLKARLQITDFILNILHSGKNIESSMILTAIAAQKISDYGTADDIQGLIQFMKSYRKQVSQASAFRAADEIHPNYKLKFIIVNNLMVKYFGDYESGINISVLHDGNNVIPDNYEHGKEAFDKVFTGREYAIRNIAENMFIDVFYHLNLTKGTFFEMFAYYTACVAAIQVFARAIGFISNNIEDDFVRAVAQLNRRMFHNRTIAEDVVDEMKALGLITPAHLAIIIK